MQKNTNQQKRKMSKSKDVIETGFKKGVAAGTAEHASFGILTDSLPSSNSPKIVTGSSAKLAHLSGQPLILSMDWDPEYKKNVDVGMPPEACLMRVKRDVTIFHNDPPPGVFIVPDKDDMTVVHSLITGPIGTPYEGGCFYFIFRFPNNYPIHPPMVKLMTTGDCKVRFNPNLYRNGKVCLSLLRTWSGPDWSPALTLPNLLLSIQSLMSEKPYHNEPGFETERHSGDADRYNDIIQHETLRVAVCDMVEGRGRAAFMCPTPLKGIMEKTFLEFYSYYESVAQSQLHLQGAPMRDPFGDQRGDFAYASILQRLRILKTKLDDKYEALNEISDGVSDDDDDDDDTYTDTLENT